MCNKLKVAVIGIGYLGSIHARIYNEIPEAELVAVVDIDEFQLKVMRDKYNIQTYNNYKDIISKVDAVSIATPTAMHYEIAKEFLENGVPVLVEKPITNNIKQAEELVKISRDKGVSLQVGHVERFNPAMISLSDKLRDAKFIEAHRLAPLKMRSMDIGVVLDLMIHDLDIILSIVDSKPKTVQAVGVNVLTKDYEDIANARINFENGAVANITASRMSLNAMRKMRFFMPEAYATVDFQTSETYIYTQSEKYKDFDIRSIDSKLLDNPMFFVLNEFIKIEKLEIEKEEPLKLEIKSFIEALREGKEPIVPGEAGLRAISLAYEILDKIHESMKLLKG